MKRNKNIIAKIKRWWYFYNLCCYYQDMSEFQLKELTGSGDWWYDNYYRRLKKLK